MKLTETQHNVLLGVSALLVLILGSMLSAFQSEQTQEPPKRTAYETYYQELELEYWGTKYAIVEQVEEYMHRYAPDNNLSALELLNGCDEYGVDIRLALAQGHVESHFGTKGLARRTNQVWNVGAFDSLSIEQISSRHKFDHPNESIAPYLELISSRYLSNSKTEEMLLQSFVDVNGRRYASNEMYEADLRHRMSAISDDTKLDSLIDRYEYLKTELKR